jgi:tRNA 2-thiouridine synthesizing protein C
MANSTPIVWISGAPYDGARTRAAIDTAMAFAVFARQPRVLFSGAAVLALVDGEASGSGRPAMRKLIDSLPLYDVERIFVDERSLARHGIEPSALPSFCECLDGDSLRAFLADAGQVLSC